MKKLFFLFVMTLLVHQGWAQKNTQALIDSLLKLLPMAQEDTNKVKLLNQLSYNYPYINPDEGLKFGRLGLDLATKLSWTDGIASAYYSIGGNYANKADYTNALENEFKALKIYEQQRNYPKQAMLLRNLGIVFHTSKNQPKALEYDLKALYMYEKLKDKEGVAAMYSNIANVYYSLKEPEKVIEYDLKSLQLYEEMNDHHGIARLLGNIANFYAEEGDFAAAMPYYFDALRRETALGNKNGVTRNMGNIGETYYDIATGPAEKIHTDSLIPAGKKANMDKALYYLEATLHNARELKQMEYILAFSEVLSDAYKASGRPKEALDTYREFIGVRDSVYDVEKYNAATRRELDYEYGKREDSIAYQQRLGEVQLTLEKKIRSREKRFYMMGILGVLVFAGFVYNRWRVTRRQKGVIEQEKKRSDDLLLNILPAETAEELKNTGTTKAREFHEVTVLFTDFKNFTTVSENLGSQELVNQINFCYSTFDNIIGKYGIEKIKTIGDSYMCAGGLPVENKTHAVDVIGAALEIRNFMVAEKQKREKDGGSFFEIRVGCHTGPVVAGIVGIKKFAYDIWGDTVNIASRMESSGEAGKVNISGSTHALVKDKFQCMHRGKIDAKNKGFIDMYFRREK